jgi:choline kinase
MKAIILAAGRGSRMESLTDEHPKCLVELHNKTLLDWQLESLRAAGISEIGIVTGYKREFLNNRGLVEFHNLRWAETNMVSSLTCAESWLKSEPCIVSYSDIIYSPIAVQSLMDSTALLAVTYDPNWLELWTQRFGNPLLDAESFQLTDDEILADIGNKPKCTEEVQGQFMGLLRFTPDGWNNFNHIWMELPCKQKDMIDTTSMLQRVIKKNNVQIKAISYNHRWDEIDSSKDLYLASSKSMY